MGFLEEYVPDTHSNEDCDVKQLAALLRGEDETAFMAKHSGQSFSSGIYRIHSASRITTLTNLCARAFPAYENQIVCFASDWSGSQFALDFRRFSALRPMVLMFEPHTDEVFEIPATFQEFHAHQLIVNKEPLLGYEFFKVWLASGGRSPDPNECVGFRKPLFLGGEDSESNLEIYDMEIYWELCIQILQQIRGIPEGTKIKSIRVQE